MIIVTEKRFFSKMVKKNPLRLLVDRDPSQGQFCSISPR